MTRSEYIIWRAESREQVEKEHPAWNRMQVTKYLNAIEAILEQKGLITREVSICQKQS